MAPLNQNPALSGVNYDLEAIINYKSQWKSVTKAYETFQTSFDMKLNKNRIETGYLAAGINFFKDKAGDQKLTTTQANFNVAYHLKMTQYHTLGIGFQGGFSQRSRDLTSMQWGSQYDGNAYNNTLPSGEIDDSPNSFTHADVGAGVVWSYKNTSNNSMVTDNGDNKLNIGFSLFHVNKPVYSFYGDAEKLNMKFVFHGNSTIITNSSNVSFLPGFMYYRQGKVQEMILGSMVRYQLSQVSKFTSTLKGSAISFGAFLRIKDALALSVLMEYAQFTIGMSYDVNISSLKAASGTRGGFEISLRFINPNPFLYKSRSRI